MWIIDFISCAHEIVARRASGYSPLSYRRRIPSRSNLSPSTSKTGVQKKFGWEFLDCEPDGIRGTGKSSVPNGVPPVPSALGGEQIRLAPCGEQLGHGV